MAKTFPDIMHEEGMVADCLVAEIGSTTTVVTALDCSGAEPRIIGQGQALTTITEDDVTIGMHNAIRQINSKTGRAVHYQKMYAVSSAAGGLRMTVHGLVYDMTVKAAREAVLGAGANIHMITAGALTERDLKKIEACKPNIVFLAGGVDYGEQTITLENAAKIAALECDAAVIYAGNCVLADEIAEMFFRHGKELLCVENVYPRIDVLNIIPARKAIQKVFEKHITKAPGMAKIRDMVSGAVLPVPGAVMSAAQLLYEHIGDLLVLDIGGATTDVHSVTPGDDNLSRLLISPEPVAKRTVEGDLGMFINAGNLIDLLDTEMILGGRYSSDELLGMVCPVPETRQQTELANAMAKKAAEVALARHAGITDYIYGVTGRKQIVRGKDLTAIRWIIGTGGALVNLPDGAAILSKLNAQDDDSRLLPRNAATLLDRDYIMAAAGVLAKDYPDAAVSLLKKSMNIRS